MDVADHMNLVGIANMVHIENSTDIIISLTDIVDIANSVTFTS